GWPIVADGIARLLPAHVAARVGEQAEAQLGRLGPACRGEGGQAVLAGLIGRLAAAMGYDAPVSVTVLDVPIVNALALPGGRILVFRQLLTEAESPEEVAGVLAHEL